MTTSPNHNYKETCRTLLKIITGCEHVLFTRRGNRSILIAMRTLAQQDVETVLYQEEGGWMTYEELIQKAQLTPLKLVTRQGLVYEQELQQHDMHAALLINSMPGYCALQDMEKIITQALTNNVIVVNDISGSIGTAQATQGDIILGSFGKAKPLNLGKGGFIATNNKDFFASITKLGDEEPELRYDLLEKKLKSLDHRRTLLLKKAQEVKQDLEDMNVVHRKQEGLNVIVRFNTEQEKERLLRYCKEKNLEYTLCPREIRILDDAISIELKRLTNQELEQ